MKNISSHYRFRQPMGSKGSCYDNELLKHFSVHWKKLVYLTDFETREQARAEIFELIELYYNRQRLHPSLGYLSPTEFVKNNVKEKQEEFESEIT